METFNRATYDALLSKETQTLEFAKAGLDLYKEACAVFVDGVWTQEREDSMNRLEAQSIHLKRIYHNACNATEKYLKDCGVLV